MAALFASGRVIDLILVLVVLEALALIGWRRVRGHGLATADVILMLLPGAILMLAIRAALTDAGWPIIGGWLAVALVAHLADLRRRWRQAG